jgi:hypothetical protein
MTERDDRELDQYLAGGSKLSRRYRDASAEGTPPELDEAVLARARAELRRKPPSLNRYFAPVALAASLVLAVNLGWNMYEAEKDSRIVATADEAQPVAAAPAPAAPPAAAEPARAAEKRELEREVAQAKARERIEFAERVEAQRRLMKEQDSAGTGAPVVDEAPAAALAPAPRQAEPLTDGQKIDRLIAHIGELDGAVFIRNGKEYGPAEAAKHLAYKRRKAGDRVKTPDDFIRLCASHSYLSGEAYLIRLADGRTRTAEDVLREELARLEGLR